MRWLRSRFDSTPEDPDGSAERALEDLRRAGAELIVNLCFPVRPGEAEELHRFAAALERRNDDVVSLGGVHAGDADPELIVRRAIEEHGMRGVKLHPMAQRFSPGDPALAPALAALAGYELPLYVHTGFQEVFNWDFPLADLESVAERHPSLPLVLCHANYPRLGWAIEMAERFESVWLDLTNVTVSIAALPPRRAAPLERELARLLAAVPDRTIIGTDYPAALAPLADVYHAPLAIGETADARPMLATNGRRFAALLGRQI